MSDQDTLGRRLVTHVETRPDETAYVFYRRHDDSGEALSWRDLWTQAEDLAQKLPLSGPGPDKGVMIFCNDEKNFVVGLLAVWLAGAVAIPAAGGMTGNLAIRNQHIFKSAKPDLVLHDLDDNLMAKLHTLAPEARCYAIPNAPADPCSATKARPVPNTRLLQYTSGSTLEPKPILLGPQELSAGCAAIETTFALSHRSIGLHWLPFYHDMGLIGAVLQAFFSGSTSVLLRPAIFIQRPLRWLELVSQWKATITSAPNFAYERVCDALAPDHALDLSSLDAVIIGGEPVRQKTVERLITHFAPFGLRPEAIAPAYGMAEATLLVSSGQTGHGPEFFVRDTGPAIANLGHPVAGLKVEIRDPETGKNLPEETEGEVWMMGPMTGRVIGKGEDWRQPGKKAEIRSGDIGFIHAGALHLTGRTSSRIIVRGKNVSAEDVEAVVLATMPEGSATGVAAFGTTNGGTEALCVLIELANRHDSLDIPALNRQIVTTFDVKPDLVMAVRRFSLPRTTSGKIRRAEVRAGFDAGQFKHEAISNVG